MLILSWLVNYFDVISQNVEHSQTETHVHLVNWSHTHTKLVMATTTTTIAQSYDKMGIYLSALVGQSVSWSNCEVSEIEIEKADDK